MLRHELAVMNRKEISEVPEAERATIDRAELLADIDQERARRSFYATSHSPERRGDMAREGYADTLQKDFFDLAKYATTPEKLDTLRAEFSRYREGYKARYLRGLDGESRCMNWFITGPANFPVERQKKVRSATEKRWTECGEFRERALKAIRWAVAPEIMREGAPIMAGDSDAVERLREKVEAAEKLRDQLKQVNKAHAAFLKDPAALDRFDLSDALKARIRAYTARYSWEPHPVAPCELTNLGARIRSDRARLESLERVKVQEVQEVKTENGIRFEDDPPANRVRLFFPGKPAAETIADLKRSGFRWTPSLGCWQAYRTAMHNARRIAGVQS